MAAAHSDETKAAVLAALLAGQSISAISAQFHVGRATVRTWRDAAGLDEHPPVIDQQKRVDLGDLLTTYLTDALTTLSVQQQHFRDKAWLRKQSAADLAVLHGVTADKTFRILEALEFDTARTGDGADS